MPDALEKFKAHCDLIFSDPLKENEEEINVSYHLLWIGEKGREIKDTWTLTNDEKKKLDTYYDKYKRHVQHTLNPIFAR